jgi:hypothetical protein
MLRCSRSKRLFYQFYATLYFDADAQKLMWMSVGQKYEITVRGFARLLRFEHELEMPPEAQIHTFGVLKLDEMQLMYALAVEAHSPKVLNFRPELNTLHRLLRVTLAPRIADSSACPQYERNLIQFYVQKKKFFVFDYMLQEIISISRIALRSCGYAPQIMMMIERISRIEFLKDHMITDLTDQNVQRNHPVLRVLKSMFAWCHDTRQCQDVLLSNQRCQNEKLGINEFDEFPLLVPPLDDDPFASLSATNLAAMEASPIGDEEASCSKYKEDKDDDDDE